MPDLGIITQQVVEGGRLKYLIIGNGIAGTTAAANIRKIDKEGSVTIMTDESYPFYSRIRLPEFISRDVDEKGLIIRKEKWYEDNRIGLILNAEVRDIKTEKNEIITSDGNTVGYDRLLLSNGSQSFIPPIPGTHKEGVFTLRTLKDAVNIRDYAGRSNHDILIIGGGVLGLEAGNGLRKAGYSVNVVEFFTRLLPRQMDSLGAGILRTQMEKMGFKFRLGAKPKEIQGKAKAEALILEDGTRIECDMILISAGVRPATALAVKAGLRIGKGVLVNDRMETSRPGIYAAGDLAEHNGICYGIWPAAEKQGEVAGINMAGGDAVYGGTVISNILKVVGIELVSAGDIDAEGKRESVVIKDSVNFVYKKIVFQGSQIIGTILYGDIKDRKKILYAIENKKDISSIRQELEKWDLQHL